ncbi:serine/threonine-protein kinase ATM-like, partial [Trifolium medium]|nr:serine/threonine-protein kinase ATM-like [Trifolium medium]
MLQHLLQSATTLRKGARFSQAAGALHEFKSLCVGTEGQCLSLYWLGRAFTNTLSYSSKLSFCTTSCYNSLFVASPCHKVTPYMGTISR